MEILHFEDLSFGCEHSCSNPRRISNFNSKVPQGVPTRIDLPTYLKEI